MPKTAMDEDHGAKRSDDDIWASWEPTVIQAVTKAKRSEHSSHSAFRGCIS
jgi:hypothetical protein